MPDDRKQPAAQSNAISQLHSSVSSYQRNPAMTPSLQGTILIPNPPGLPQNQINPNITMASFPSQNLPPLPQPGNNQIQAQAIMGHNLIQFLAQDPQAPRQPAYFQNPNLQSSQSNIQQTLHRYNSTQPITDSTGTGTTTDTSSERNDHSNRVRKRRHSPSPP